MMVVANILSFVNPPGRAFDETARLIGEAYDAACQSLILETSAAREGLASRIIDAARAGERDPARLIEAGLKPPR
jgi:hypothetical protein